MALRWLDSLRANCWSSAQMVGFSLGELLEQCFCLPAVENCGTSWKELNFIFSSGRIFFSEI